MPSSMVTLLALLLTATPPCRADEPLVRDESPAAFLPEGARVRLKLNDERKSLELPGKLEGRIISADQESLTLRLRVGREVTVPVRAVERLQVPAGRQPRWWGALNGLGVGALVGAGVSGIAMVTCKPDPEWGCLGPVLMLVYGTPVAAGAGAVVGALLPPAERWETRRPRVAAQPVLVPDGVGVRVAVSF